MTKLVEVYRGRLIESLHRGAIVVVRKDGQILAQWGNAEMVTFWRSSAKPIQAIPVVASGAADAFNLSAEEIAIMTGSHAGELLHVRVVQGMLDKLGLTKENLHCGIHSPFSQEAAWQIAAQGRRPEVWHSDCSGKHGGMLALARHLGVDVAGYTDIQHPVQQAMLEVVSRYTQMAKEDIELGIDGCGVPVFAMPLYNMALAYGQMTAPDAEPAAKRVVKSMLQHPEMVAGTRRLCTELMRVGKGKLIAKLGAEGVQCVGLVDRGIGIALKIEDGNLRALSPVIIEVLQRLGYLDSCAIEELKDFHYPQLMNHRQEIVGEMRPAF